MNNIINKENITILIPTRFNSRYNIELCLETIRKYTKIPYLIMIGDSGVDGETRAYLDAQPDIKVVRCPDPVRPKDCLARKVRTEYFLILHDDNQIKKEGWLSRRLKILEQNSNVGVLGQLSFNYLNTPIWKRSILNSCLQKRLFPNVMMVRKKTQDELDLNWGKIGNGEFGGFDTGAIAYLQLLRQKKWKFQRYLSYYDVKHWNCKTWAVRKKLRGDKYKKNIDEIIAERDDKISDIIQILKNREY